MTSRGEERFGRLSALGAASYQRLMAGPGQRQTTVFAQDCAARLKAGRLLDVGTGPGRALRELRRLSPDVELYGLDVSAAMLDLARRNLAGIAVDLRQGSIAHTGYADGFFDLVTCTKSFYLWDDPAAGLAEIHRILKPGGAALLFESTRDYDPAVLARQLREGMRTDGPFKRAVIRAALGRQLRETYSNREILDIVERTPFHGSCRLEPIPGVLCIWVRVTLSRQP
jgi:ubiquinone/menaquinone biosynthesis C-methylase UbiE